MGTNPEQESYLRSFTDVANICRNFKFHACTGSLEVRLFKIPGWDEENVNYPDHSRVNHAKFAVSDNALNVGTSNWDWGYFHNTAGASFHTDDAALVATGNAISSKLGFAIRQTIRWWGECFSA